jgi:hypothetical protein
MPQLEEPAPPPSILNILVEKLLQFAAAEFDKPETKTHIRQRIMLPLTKMIYDDLYPYIMLIAFIILVMFVLSILTFVGFVVYYLKTL